ncbi:MAG: class II fructose-bisphosphate aldolase [Microcystis aeruginosa]
MRAINIYEALEAGMTSIMADGSHLPYQDNLAFTKEMTRLAHEYGAVVEAEIGRISGTEDGLTIAEKEAKMTDPEQAVQFVQATGVDSLAVTIGNVHGEYKSPPRLDFDRLAQIRQLLSIPPEMIGRSVQLGVCKFNVNTEVRQAYMQSLKREICRPEDKDLLEIAGEAISAMKSVIIDKLTLFGAVNKAHLHETPYAQMLAGLSVISKQ